jgi:hypothetical protein
MEHAPRFKRLVRRGASFFSLGILLFTCACTNTDFGQVRPSLVRDDIHDWVGPAATGSSPSVFQPTDDERQLRDLAYPLIEPPYDRQRWYSALSEHGFNDEIGRSFDRTAYAANLMSSRYRSANTRYSQLIEDVRNDVTRLPAFFEAAARVLDIDARRRKALGHIREMSPFERDNAGKRMAENAAIVAMVRGSLERRVASYQFALERLVIVTPSPQAVEAERLLGQLKGKMAFYRKWAPTGRGERVAFDY